MRGLDGRVSDKAVVGMSCTMSERASGSGCMVVWNEVWTWVDCGVIGEQTDTGFMVKRKLKRSYIYEFRCEEV